MARFGWCLVWPGTPHVNCLRQYVPTQGRDAGKLVKCDCPCHLENDKALEELI